jgi:signal peptidase
MKINLMENKVFAKIANAVATIVLVFAILICVLVIASMKSSTGMAQLFGYSLLSVQSESMEPVFYKGDLIVIKCTDENMVFNEGEIITFTAYNDYGKKFLNTHRIIKKHTSSVRNSYVTKGDNADSADSRKVYQNFVLGKYTGHKLSGFGTVLDYVSSGTGVLVFVVFPSLVIIIWQIYIYIKESSKRKREFLEAVALQAQSNSGKYVEEYIASQGLNAVKPVADPQNLPEYEKQQVIQDYLRAQQEEEEKKKAIINEYIEKQKEAEKKADADVEAAKIKAIISEFLAQQRDAEREKSGTNNNEEQEEQEEQEGQEEQREHERQSEEAAGDIGEPDSKGK